MNNDEFLKALQMEASTFTAAVATEEGDWIVKGFIDVYKRIYTISVDTKVVSKVLELLLYRAFVDFAARHGFTLELPPQQNFYPDLTFTSQATGERFAVDIKSTYRKSRGKVSGMTLGAFTGYFRHRTSNKNTLYPYGQYTGHYVLGVVYSQHPEIIDERQQYTFDDLEKIQSVIRDFVFFAQPKYRIASATPGSGNTANIGSVVNLKDLLNGTGPFAIRGEEIYDDYWMHYLNKDMARKIDAVPPYTNIETYAAYKSLGIEILKAQEAEINRIVEEPDDTEPDNAEED